MEVGQSAGKTISLPGLTLRSIDLNLLGGGFGFAPLSLILAAIPTLFAMATAGALKVAVEPVPLAEVESAWNRVEKDAGLFSRYREKAGPECFLVTDDRDREHFGGGTVSKTIEGAGHLGSNQCPVSRAL